MPDGQVIRTEPAADAKAPRDSAVSIVVSKGPDIVIVPDLTNKTIDEATARRPGGRAHRSTVAGRLLAGQEGAGPGLAAGARR